MSEIISPGEQEAEWQAPETGYDVDGSLSSTEAVETKSDAEEYSDTLDAVMALAEENLPDEQAINLIAQLLKEQLSAQNRYFPHLIERLDPDSYSSETKLASEKAQGRLRQALESLRS